MCDELVFLRAPWFSEKYDLKDITNAWVHLTFNDFVEGDRFDAEPENKIIVTPVRTFEAFNLTKVKLLLKLAVLKQKKKLSR